MNTTITDRPVGQLVAEQPGRSRVFERWGIDYCCGGRKTLGDVCEKKQLDAEALVRDLAAADSTDAPPETDWMNEPLVRLCDHIESTHHAYLRQALPRLTLLTAKVADRHAEKDPRLAELCNLFVGFRAEMEDHMAKEETIVFPAIRLLDAGVPTHPVAGPIEAMHVEHDQAGAALETMRTLTDEFGPTRDACNTHRALLHALAELEADMHQHVHKENNILFARAIEREGALA